MDQMVKTDELKRTMPTPPREFIPLQGALELLGSKKTLGVRRKIEIGARGAEINLGSVAKPIPETDRDPLIKIMCVKDRIGRKLCLHI